MSKLLIVKFAIAGVVVVFGSAVASSRTSSVKSQASTEPLLRGAVLNPEVLSALQKSCANCHSEKTEWPWYSYVPPASWMIEKDVRQGRERLNLSRWDEYSRDKQQELLSEIGVMVKTRKMPLPKYTLLHPGAKLTHQEIDQIYNWSRAERRRLRALDLRNAPSGL